MTPITWKPDLSLGNVITIVTLIAGIATGWASFAGRIEMVSSSAAKMEQRIERLEAQRQDDRNAMTEIRTDLRYIRQAVESLERSGTAAHPQP